MSHQTQTAANLLVHRLSAADTEQHDTFFIGYPALLSPQDVLRVLIRRFDEASCAIDVCDELQTKLGGRLWALCNLLILIISVLRLIHSWLTNQNAIIPNDVLAEMQDFADAVSGSDALEELAVEVLQRIPDKVQFLLLVIVPISIRICRLC